MDGGAAVLANQTDQALRQDAIQRGNKVVRLDSHVEEASNDIHDVVSVDCGEYQVAGERRLNGDLRGFRVADFANHDFVRVVAQDGAQAAGKGQALFFVHRNLRDAADLVFHRIFNGDDLVFFGLDFVHRGIERGGLAAARGSGDQHHAIGFFDVAPETLQVVLVESHYIQNELLKLFAHRFFVENAKHGVLAVDGGHDGDAEINGPLRRSVLHAEASILWHAPLGNVQLAHDFYARDDGGVMVFGDGRHGLSQHAINAEFNADRVIAGFNVNVGGAALQGGKNRGVHQADDGADVALRGQLVNGNAFVGIAVFIVDHIQREAFAGVFQHALGLLSLFQDFADLRQRGHLGQNAFAQQNADFINHHQLAGVGDGDGQAAVAGFFQGN